MFRIEDRAIAPHKAKYERAIKRLPQAHLEAQVEAARVLHQHATNALQASDIDPSALSVVVKDGLAHVAIDHTPQGDVLFDQEFGGAETAPNPVVRTAVSSKRREAQHYYQQALFKRLGV
jgi:hypothetical protein